MFYLGREELDKRIRRGLMVADRPWVNFKERGIEEIQASTKAPRLNSVSGDGRKLTSRLRKENGNQVALTKRDRF